MAEKEEEWINIFDRQRCKQIREKTNLSQAKFAILFLGSKKTVQSWEYGLRKPSGSAIQLMRLIEKDPKNVIKQIQSL